MTRRETAAKCAPPSTQATTSPIASLAKNNLNNIDLLMTLDHDFLSAVALLERTLNEHLAKQPKEKPPANP